MKKLVLLIAVLLAGCDNAGLMTNLDTYLCAYLPGAIDCSAPEVHDKAVSILENGMVEAHMTCHLTIPYMRNDEPNPTIEDYYTLLEGTYEVTAFHDGSKMTSCQVGGPIDYWANFDVHNLIHYSASHFLSRSHSSINEAPCFIDVHYLNITPFMFEINDGVIHIQKGQLFPQHYPPHQYDPIEGNCYGLNLEYFE